MTTRNELIQYIRENIGERTPRFVDDVAVTVWINQAIKDVARRTELFQARATITTVVNTQEYTLPSNLIRINSVDYQPTGMSTVNPLEYRDRSSMDEVWWANMKGVQRATLSHFTLWGSPPALTIILWPTPSTAGTLTIWYYKQPADLVAGNDVNPLPAGWDDLIVHYCEYRYLRKAHDARWQEAKGLYEEAVDQIMNKTRRYTDGAGQIVGGGGFGGLPSWLVNGE